MINWGEIKQEYETTKITLAKLAEKHDIPLGTIKSQKSRDTKNGNPWVRDGTKKDATKIEKVATISEDATKPKQHNRSGNPNPLNQFTKRNQAARKHGLRAKYFSAAQQEIMEDFEDFSLLDKLWVQIEIKFSAIIQMQKIMWVEYADQTLDEVSLSASGEGGSTTGYKVVYAFEQFEAYIKAQARAMAEYRNLVTHYLQLSGEDDERRLKLKKMQLDVDKTTAEIDVLNKSNQKQTSVITIVDEWAGDDDG